MSIKPVSRPYENTKMAIYLRKQIEKLQDLGINQRQIALEAGYCKPNILSMFKRGETKVPLNKAVMLANALRCDPSFFFRLAAQQPDMPFTASEIDKIFPNSVSAGEMKIVDAIREATGGDVDPTDEQLGAVTDIFRVVESRRVSLVPKSPLATRSAPKSGGQDHYRHRPTHAAQGERLLSRETKQVTDDF